MKGKVKKNAEKQIKELIKKEPGIWLGKGVPFKHELQLDDKSALLPLFNSCEITNRKENIIAFEILIANLLQYKIRRPVSVSLSPNRWKKTSYFRAGPAVIEIINKLFERGYLEMKKGYYTKEKSRMTRIWPTEKLLQYFEELPAQVIYNPVNLVELKDKKGKLKDYKDTNRTKKIKAILKQANEVNQRADIRYHKYNLSGFLVAVFTRKFTLYGRLHTRGYRHYQGLSEDERAEITINGEPIVELDYSGLHPYLLYAKEGFQFRGDPYSIIDNRSEVRSFLKIILLAMLNAKDKTTAERAANHWLYLNHDERADLAELKITKARPLIDSFRQVHKRIDHYFCNGNETGLRVMNLDAIIALDVVKNFTEQEIPILAIHDSFIVQEKHQGELHRTMKKAYQKHTGFRILVK